MTKFSFANSPSLYTGQNQLTMGNDRASSTTTLRPRWSAIQPPHGYASVEIKPPKPPSELSKPNCDMRAPRDKTNG